MYCKYCGKELDDASKFCPACGTKIEAEFSQSSDNQPNLSVTVSQQPSQPECLKENTVQIPQNSPAATTLPETKKKRLKWWHIALIIAGSILFLIFLIVIISGISGGKATNHVYSPFSYSDKTSANEIPIVGDWKIDFSESEEAIEKFFLTIDPDASIIFDILGESVSESLTSQMASCISDCMTVRFNEDNTETYIVNAAAYRDAVIKVFELMIDAYAKMSPEDLSKVTGESLDSINEKIQSKGMPWEKYWSLQKERISSQLQAAMTDEDLVRMFDGELDQDGRIWSEKSNYSLKGNRFLEGNMAMTLSYKNDVITIEDVSYESTDESEGKALSVLFKGVKLIRIND